MNNCYAKPWNNKKHNITDKRLNNINKLQMGELIQLDHIVINNLNEIPIRLFNTIDSITTKLTVSFGYAGANSRNASLFLKEKMLKLFPFKIKSIQADGGSEFMKYFEETCKELNIKLYVLPPYRPKYNGGI